MRRSLVALAGLVMLATACGSGDEADAAPTIVIDGVVATSEAADQADESDTSADGDGASDSAGVGSDEVALADPAASDEEQALVFAQCMRDNGLAEFQDPVVNADGSITLDGGGPGVINPDDPALEGAFDACSELLAGASFVPGAGIDQSEIEDNLLAMAQCLRDAGHTVDDPDLSGGLNPARLANIFGADFDPTDPANSDDLTACQLDVFGPDGPPGPGAN